MKRLLTALAAFAAGAGAMYFLDPEMGRRRRALVADQVNHLAHVLGEGAEGKATYLRDRTYGAWARMRRLFDRDATIDDDPSLAPLGFEPPPVSTESIGAAPRRHVPMLAIAAPLALAAMGTAAHFLHHHEESKTIH